MQFLIAILTLAAFGLAGYLWWNEGSANYAIALIAGMFGSLLSPLWQLLYRFEYNESLAPLFSFIGRELPRAVFFGGWLMVLPPLVIFYLFRLRWWFPGYMTGLLTFVLFVVYYLLLEAVGVRLGTWTYQRGSLPLLNLPMSFLSALMNGLSSLGMLSLLLLTRRYALTSLLMLLLPAPFVLSLFVNGLLGAPLYTALLLEARNLASNWATVIGALGTLGLLLWGAHTVASVIEGQQPPRPAVS